MVFEPIDILRFVIPRRPAAIITLGTYILILALYSIIFTPQRDTRKDYLKAWALRFFPFAFILGIGHFTLLLDSRLFFLLPILFMYVTRGWRRFGVAALSMMCVIDGVVFLFYAILTAESRKQQALMCLALILPLISYGAINIWQGYGHPFRHFYEAFYQHGYIGMEVEIPPRAHIRYIIYMHENFWGWGGVALGVVNVSAAILLWKKREPLMCLYTFTLTLIILNAPFLLADVWRYFMPQGMVACGLLGRKVKKPW